MKKEQTKNYKNNKKMFICAMAVTIILVFVLASMAWFYFHRSLQTITEVNSPIKLYITAGNQEAIENLDLGDIDVEDGTSKDYVFCVYGSPADDYILQLAHTTNIPFTYKIYKATENGSGTASQKTGCVSYQSENKDKSGNRVYYYYEKADTPVSGSYLNLSNNDGKIADNTYHDASYGSETGVKSYDQVQKNAEPLYWQTSVSVTPDELSSGDFCHYYILEVSWDDADKIENNKETDIVYLMAGQSSED
jgi:hypothetical protein